MEDRSKWEDNIKMNLEEIAQDVNQWRVVIKTIMNLRIS
jgi:hypothetical protein